MPLSLETHFEKTLHFLDKRPSIFIPKDMTSFSERSSGLGTKTG